MGAPTGLSFIMESSKDLTPEERKKMNYLPGEQKKCAKCGKKFYVARNFASSYAYKKKIKYGRERFYCSWTCFRA